MPAVAAASSGSASLPTFTGGWWWDIQSSPRSFDLYAQVRKSDFPDVSDSNPDNYRDGSRDGEWSVEMFFGAEAVSLNYAYGDRTENGVDFWEWSNNNLPRIDEANSPALFAAVNLVSALQDPVAISGRFLRNGVAIANLTLNWRFSNRWP